MTVSISLVGIGLFKLTVAREEAVLLFLTVISGLFTYIPPLLFFFISLYSVLHSPPSNHSLSFFFISPSFKTMSCHMDPGGISLGIILTSVTWLP